jgi:nitroimidazol reductase NimA-like FMN-containing flavoprotein (pyridoxamine 5'-phosphate oxidase superfamily)
VSVHGDRSGDLARRVRERRLELGLSHEEVAQRAGMAAGYVEYLEGAALAALSYGGLMRLAAALQTTPEALSGGGIERPPGHGTAGGSPLLGELDPADCERRLEAGGVGRIVFDSEEGPAALPVSFGMLDGDVVFRTSEGGTIARALDPDGVRVGFEVDHIDDALHEGWSVLVHGHASRIVDAAKLERARALGIEPWSGAERNVYVGVSPVSVTGRRIRATAR